MTAADLAGRAERLRELHRTGRPLVLPNAWDAASARAFEAAGFPAVATSSSAVAATLGYADHEAAPPDEMLAAVARIAAAVSVPVTADVEAGYGLTPAELVGRLLDAGAAGCNLEDTDHRRGGLTDAGAQAERLAAVVDAATAAGVGVVVNARVDTFRHGDDGDGDGPDGGPVTQAVARGRRYLAAGADCVYPIMARREEDIAALVGGIGGPVNVLYRPGAPSLARLAELGVARVTFGGGLHMAARAAVERIAARLRDTGDPYRRG
jgi:2-methylisocitrate lyase-like PEP mutase family enzyme